MGYEIAMHMLHRNHAVTVVCDEETELPNVPFPVISKPTRKQLKKLFREADAVYGNHLSFKLLKPLFFSLRKPHCIVLQREIHKFGYRLLFQSKLFKTDRVYASTTQLAKKAKLGTRVIRNSYDASIYNNNEPGNRTFDLMFRGDLVPESGIELFIDAIHLISTSIHCVVVGDGPMRSELEKRAPQNTTFLGHIEAPYIVELMRQTKWVVFPSKSAEFQDIKMVEAIACGSRIIACKGELFDDVVGPCGISFKTGNVRSLMMTIHKAMERDELLGYTEKEKTEHLAKFSLERRYNSIMQVLHQ